MQIKKSPQDKLKEVQNQYSQLCAELGDLTIKSKRFTSRIAEIETIVVNLDKVAGNLQAEIAELAAKEKQAAELATKEKQAAELAAKEGQIVPTLSAVKGPKTEAKS